MARSGDNHKGRNTVGATGTIVNGQDLARLMGVARSTVGTYAKQGMPILDNDGLRGAPRFDTAACIRWWKDQELRKVAGGNEDDDLSTDEIYRLTALTKLKQEEIKLARDQERYADIDAVLHEFGMALSNVRAALMKLPTYAAQLEHQDAITIDKKLTDKVDHILQELSEFEPDGEPE